MKREYDIDLSVSGINRFIGVLGGYKIWMNRKAEEVCKRLAEMGAIKAEVNFDSAYYDGPVDEDFKVEVVPAGKLKYKVRASGTTVLFVEFGTGLIGDGHPEAAENGMGPGTYPPTDPFRPRWDQIGGWYYKNGDEKQHTHGNPPNMFMYNTVKELETELERVVKEVFAHD